MRNALIGLLALSAVAVPAQPAIAAEECTFRGKQNTLTLENASRPGFWKLKLRDGRTFRSNDGFDQQQADLEELSWHFEDTTGIRKRGRPAIAQLIVDMRFKPDGRANLIVDLNEATEGRGSIRLSGRCSALDLNGAG